MTVQFAIRKVPAWLLGLFVGLPLLELFILIKLGRFIGVFPTIALVVITGIVGGTLAHNQGLAMWRRLRAELSAGRLPAAELVEGLLILVAGIVLLTPGLITDLAGLALLIPVARKGVLRLALRKLKRKLQPDRGQADYIDV